MEAEKEVKLDNNTNSGNWNSGCFNTNEPNARLFNKDTNLKISEINFPSIGLELTKWVDEESMTEQQKMDNPNFSITKGVLIQCDYKEAWAIAWWNASNETKKQFLDLPNFDAEIFFEITGVRV